MLTLGTLASWRLGTKVEQAGSNRASRRGKSLCSSMQASTAAAPATKALRPLWGVEAWHCTPLTSTLSQHRHFSATSMSAPVGEPESGTM